MLPEMSEKESTEGVTNSENNEEMIQSSTKDESKEVCYHLVSVRMWTCYLTCVFVLATIRSHHTPACLLFGCYGM